jgi:hypothetical protein
MRLQRSDLTLRDRYLVELAPAKGLQRPVRLHSPEDHGQPGPPDDDAVGRLADEPERPGQRTLDRLVAELGVQCNPEGVCRS